MKTAAIILAAGSGKRMQADKNKMLLTFLGKTVLEHTVEAFQKHPEVDGIVVVGKQEELELIGEILSGENDSKLISCVSGGKERQDSVLCGLQALDESWDVVLIHDGARPFVKPELLSELLQQVQPDCGAVAGVPSKDTIKQVREDGIVEKTLNRSLLWNVQTPQCFYRKAILQYYVNALQDGVAATDDASLAEHYGGAVKMVQAYYENIKLTTPEDLEVAEVFYRRIRKGEKNE